MTIDSERRGDAESPLANKCLRRDPSPGLNGADLHYGGYRAALCRFECSLSAANARLAHHDPNGVSGAVVLKLNGRRSRQYFAVHFREGNAACDV